MIIATIISRILLFLAGVWSTLVVYLAPIFPQNRRELIAGLVALLFLAVVFRRKRAFVYSLPVIAAVFLLWYGLRPRNDRDWKPEVAQLASVDINGNSLTFRNIRDFRWRTETDFDVRYQTKQVLLSELSSLDLYSVYWSGKDIAHIFVSFGFKDGTHIAVSIEARNTKTQSYSTINGFFRNSEIVYVVAEERDLVSLRTHARQPHEEVYLLRTRFDHERAAGILMSYIKEINSLSKTPQFYNTLTSNCTTQVLTHSHEAGGTVPYNWRVLLSGHTPELLYMYKRIDTRLPLEELMKRSFVNPRSDPDLPATEFSKRIREGVPEPGESAG